MPQRPKKLLDQVRDAIRLKHYAYSTEKTYVYWAKRFVLYHNMCLPPKTGPRAKVDIIDPVRGGQFDDQAT